MIVEDSILIQVSFSWLLIDSFIDLYLIWLISMHLFFFLFGGFFFFGGGGVVIMDDRQKLLLHSCLYSC